MEIDSEKIVKKLAHKLEKLPLPISLKNESDLEFAVLPIIKRFIQKELGINDKKHILYHHGRNKDEKNLWSKSKPLQNIELLGTHTYDMLIIHPKIGSLVLEFKYAASAKNPLTSRIQRIIGQSLIAKLKHPYVISCLVFKRKGKRPQLGLLEKLKKDLQENHKIYLIVRDH
ncbi:MAG: hypothetical protein A2913_00920 [Parcubacteria group bacterium RIFCSPLOWO2_01_FULL_40_65]|nr:MAG: hypothetical protein A2734_02980 [Parcubacteria group bacterium RIFCSPHIGHO2_01_FULL_40_30]OHB18935.1 MAG: hypothetical protein A3D40_00440 [Parcubacteria group bacterium RIFCSPHIGHO2_02_FULL_40_12]OHB21715.1 MAG: hypothetical protein A2913_00920 [Parcubacteria group bacterium RIFCSPLOWO2_01_FULL_40_65]OHB22778.1 MAG: hypothetical protein A3I22_02700 [Parcubacteria group bacterium RIFCSPLOWO2_02_FULL_40_12]OHB23963.1 MAG: hypothetical protein A3F96_00265 [Parcubacteria group bacterium R